MNKIVSKQNRFKKGVKLFLWALTILSILFFIYKVVVFSTSVSYYDFELDEEVKPTISMILSYSIGAFVGTSIAPLVVWLCYGLFYFLKSDRYKIIVSNWKSKINNATTASSPTNKEYKSINLTSKFAEISSKINPKTKNLIGFIWILFHLLMLLTSNEIFEYRISWVDFWFFDSWENYDQMYYKSHYDISEFIVYVIIPLIIVFGRKYLKGEAILNLKMTPSTVKTNTDEQINDLKKYKELFDLGVISEEEFVELKKKLL
jgi:hypothetical protein